ncbi:hypothetical protein RJ641_025215 [Dillenia turbinata]|uniref:Uncharacterized protein n=1 Tax=Dillenia turbinata TaxID=194707 RepID=A0AAN8WCN9_9MAGN
MEAYMLCCFPHLDYDPEMPPELAAATGIHDVQGDNGNIGKQEAGQSDLAEGPAHVRPPFICTIFHYCEDEVNNVVLQVHAFFLLVYLQIAEFIFLLPPTSRAIQVETGYGECLPSIDTRPPWVCDSDVIIEDSLDDDSSQGNGALEQQGSHCTRPQFFQNETNGEGINIVLYFKLSESYSKELRLHFLENIKIMLAMQQILETAHQVGRYSVSIAPDFSCMETAHHCGSLLMGKQ